MKDTLNSIDISNVEIESGKEIEYEIDEWTSLFYSVEEEIYYAYQLDTYDEEEYKAPINIEDDTDLLFNITVEDKHTFQQLITDLKNKGEL